MMPRLTTLAFTWFMAGLLPACGMLSYQKEGLDLYFEAMDESRILELQKKDKPELPQERKEDLRRALETMQASIAVFPLFPPSYKLAIDMAWYLNEFDEEKRLLNRAVALFPDSAEFRLRYIEHLMRKQESAAAEALIEEGMTRDPLNIPIRFSYAEMLLSREGFSDEAGQLILDTLKISDLPDEVYSQAVFFSFLLEENGEHERAESILLKSASASEVGVHQATALALNLNLMDAVISLFDQVMLASPSPANLESEYIRLLIALNRIDRVEERFDQGHVERAAEALDRPAMSRVLFGYLLFARGDVDAAQAIFRERLAEDPAATDALEGWMVLYQQYPSRVDGRALAQTLRASFPHIEDPYLQMSMGGLYKQIMESISPGNNSPQR